MLTNILVNAIRTPDGTILQSKHRHDYVEYQDKTNNLWYAVDGGLDYIKRCCDSNDYENLNLVYGDDHSKIREFFTWKSYGKEGELYPNGVVNYLKDLDKDHIVAIIDTQHHLPEHIRNVFKDEIVYRTMNNI